MKSTRVTLTAMAAAAVVLGFFLVPLPVTRIREHGIVQFQPEHLSNVYVTTEGILVKVHVKEGEFVPKHKILAEFENVEYDKKLIDLRATISAKQELIRLYEQKRNEARDPRDKNSLTKSILTADADLKSAESAKNAVEQEKSQMVLRAPRAGVVIGLPAIDEVGKAWDKGQETPFCGIGDRSKLRVLIPVHPADMDVMAKNFQKLGEQEPLPVTIRVQGMIGSLWCGAVFKKDLPKSEAAEIPPGLSSKGGGHIAVRPVGTGQKLIPQAQVYLVPINFEDPQEIVCTNSMAQVKIHCEYRSAAWWVWRTVSSVFDLGLM